MKRALGGAAAPAAAALAVAATLIGSGTAHADPSGQDPHMPNGSALWCQGGISQVGIRPVCDGLPYPDGSYWHQEATSIGFGGPAALDWQPPVLVKP